MTTFTLLVLVILAALAFDFINGFHDTANAIATVVSTGALRPRTAVLLAAAFNVAGAFMGTAVATTIGRDLVDPALMTQQLVLSALLAAIAWNLFTWYFGIPSSSSHALVGGLVGACIAGLGTGHLRPEGIEKVVTALIVSPFFGFFGAFFLMLAMYWTVRRVALPKVNRAFQRLQYPAFAYMSISHGLNDAQKTMGVITMALVSYEGTYDPAAKFPVPLWVVLACALAMGLGTAAGGWRIVHTMGSKIFKMRPIHGCVAQVSAATVITLASHFGLPTSTTHCITSSIMGAGATARLSAVSWGVTQRILWAWVLTIPICASLSWLTYELFLAIGLGA